MKSFPILLLVTGSLACRLSGTAGAEVTLTNSLVLRGHQGSTFADYSPDGRIVNAILQAPRVAVEVGTYAGSNHNFTLLHTIPIVKK